ncbi:hypothetical protein [Pedobacter psychrodurus]|uniref:hypothetical protein n=1 Tax=Pedobacter psychrodurus TaxID=2530456 RepID=UPI00292ED814|nr:hypothetical protein [Pedobacter psychrodurus]
MAKYYHITADSITIRPLAFLVPIGIAIVVLLLLLPLSTILILVKGHLGDIETKYFASYFFMLPFLFACIPFFTYGKRQVIFDALHHTISLKTIFGKKKLMDFNEVASIDPQVRFGLVYYLKSSADRYGKGYRISPSFTGEQDKDKLHFDSHVLSEIKLMIAKVPDRQANNILQPISMGILTHYVSENDSYRLKSTGIGKFLPMLIFFGLFACYFWYNLFTKNEPSGSDKQLSFIILIPILIFLLSVTKRVVFETSTKKIKVYRLGIVFKSYALEQFAGFNIVRKTTNGLYSGTDVRLKFNKSAELTLADFGKTNPIETFIAETEYILKKMESGTSGRS